MSEQLKTKKVKINKEGYLQSLDITDADVEIEVDFNIYNKLLIVKNGYNWQYKNNIWQEVPLLDQNQLRQLREINCFRYIDRKSPLWWSHLSKEQQQQLDSWYQAWLEVTETKIIPEKPAWLK